MKTKEDLETFKSIARNALENKTEVKFHTTADGKHYMEAGTEPVELSPKLLQYLFELGVVSMPV